LRDRFNDALIKTLIGFRNPESRHRGLYLVLTEINAINVLNSGFWPD